MRKGIGAEHRQRNRGNAHFAGQPLAETDIIQIGGWTHRARSDFTARDVYHRLCNGSGEKLAASGAGGGVAASACPSQRCPGRLVILMQRAVRLHQQEAVYRAVFGLNRRATADQGIVATGMLMQPLHHLRLRQAYVSFKNHVTAGDAELDGWRGQPAPF